MKSLSKLVALVSGVTAVALVALSMSPVLADSPGQIVSGPNVYVVKNLTQHGTYTNSVATACGDEVEYSAELHNPMNGGLTSIVVSANLGSGSVSAVPAEGASQGVTASVSVSTPAGSTLAYENGTTVLYDGNGNVIRTLSDSVTNGGVNIGNLPGSTTEFVNFKAKVSCPTPTPTPPTVATTAKALPNTGPGDVFEMFAGASSVGAAGHYFVAKRRK